MAMQTINFITWNVNGLKRNRDKKFQVLQNADVVFLQETHIREGDEHILECLKNEWHVSFTKFTSRMGTAILIKKRPHFEKISEEKDNCGTYVVLKCKLGGQLYTLVSVYNHEKDTKTLDKLSRYLQSMTTGLLVIGGDFNTVLNPFIDKDNQIHSNEVTDSTTHRKLRCCVKKFMKSLQLVDIWRRKNPTEQKYTFHSQVASRLDYFFLPEECMWRVRCCKIRHSEMRDHHPVYLEINNTPTIVFLQDLQRSPVIQWFNLKKDILVDEMGSLLDEESSHAVSEVDIISAVNSLQVSDTPRPDGIPVSFYKDKIQDLIPYIKMLYDRIHRGTFNCSEKHFNETVKSPHDNSQHFFNIDYLIIATILAKRLDDYMESQSKGRAPKNSVAVMITPKTFCTEMKLSLIQDEIENQKLSNPALYQDFFIVKNLLRDAPGVDTGSAGVSIERDKLLDQGCPLTPVLITLALKCFASALAGHLKQHEILFFQENVILCIQPEDLEKIIAAVKKRANEVFYIKDLSKRNVEGEQLKYMENESKDEYWYESEAETLMDNTKEESEASWSKTNKGNKERRVCEEHNFVPMIQEDISVEGDGRLTMYSVVTLLDSDEVMVAPSNWLSPDKKQCYWPPFKSTGKCMEAVQNRISPETEGKPWEKLNISFHREVVTFEKAKEEQKNIEEQKERRYLLATGFSPILKRQSTQGMSKQKHQVTPASPASTFRMSADDKDELLQMLKDIKSTVQENSAMLKKLLKDNTVPEVPSSTCVPPKEVNTSLNLPLRTFDDMERTERELKTTTMHKKYVKYLSGLGGFGNRDVIKNIMQHVLTDDLAKEFNWQGRGEKKPFSQLILADVIREAAFKRNVIRVDCEAEIKKYLSYTADRLSRKRPREQEGPGHEIPNQIPTLMDNQPEMSWDVFYDDI